MKRIVLLVLTLCITLTAREDEQRDGDQREPWTVGVALSGGAALGLAHVGVLKVLEDENIPVSCISGTSMGSIVAGMYAAGYTAAQMDSILTTVDWSTLFSERIPEKRMSLARREEGYRNVLEVTHRWFIPRIPSGVVSLQNVEILLTELLSEVSYDAGYDFDSLAIPFRCVAADVGTGDRVVFNSGSMVDAIRASIAIPAVFEPAQVGSVTYIDGGAVQNLPVEPLLEFEPDFIIASDVIRWSDETRSIIDVVTRSMAIVTEENRRQQRALASVVLYPNVDEFLPSDFGRASELVAAGEFTARLAMPAIKQRLGDHPIILEQTPPRSRPRPVVSNVRIEGLKTTRESYVRRQILTKPGDTLDFETLVGDMERLRQLDLFRHITHRLEFGEETVDVVYSVIEKNYGIYGLALYYDNDHGFAVRLEIARSNILGTGAKVGLSTTLGEPRDGRVSISGARFGFLPFTYRIEAFHNRTTHAYYDRGQWLYNFVTSTWGLDTEFGYALGKQAYFTFGYELRDYTHLLPSVAGDESFQEILNGPTLRLRYSSLDNLSFPADGLDFTLSAKWCIPIYGEVEEFVKVKTGFMRYYPFGDRVVLGIGAGYGLGIDTLSRTEVFRLGGNDLVGARMETFASFEFVKARVLLGYRLGELLNNPRYPLRVELTTDIALFNPFYYSTYPDYETFMGVQAGVAGNTPLGPVRVSVGFSSDRRLIFRIAVGAEPRERM